MKWVVRIIALCIARILPLNLFKNVLGLIVLAKYFPKMYIIFDGLPGEEARALEDFLAINVGTFTFQGYASNTSKFPIQVAVEYKGKVI